MMKKRIAALVTAGVLALSMLTGCGSKQESWKVTCPWAPSGVAAMVSQKAAAKSPDYSDNKITLVAEAVKGDAATVNTWVSSTKANDKELVFAGEGLFAITETLDPAKLQFSYDDFEFVENLYSSVFVREAMAGAGSLKLFLPAVIFLIGAAIGFATGTSWGTIGIMAPIVVSVFDYDVEPILCTIGLAAACSGGVMGDHCSPISDTTIMASAGAHCFHLNHVFTQIPYALTVTGVSFVSFILAGLIQNVVINLIIAVALMIGTLLVIKAIVSSKHAGIFSEMVEANKSLAHQ